jgi:hypothetical protein
LEEENIRNSIRKFLIKKPRNTAEISFWLSKINKLSNIDLAEFLESDTGIVRIGEIRNSGVIYPSNSLSEWATKEWAEDHRRHMVDDLTGGY